MKVDRIILRMWVNETREWYEACRQVAGVLLLGVIGICLGGVLIWSALSNDDASESLSNVGAYNNKKVFQRLPI